MVFQIHPSKTLIYVRVSTKKQATNFSLATQEQDCREYAQRHGINNVAGCLMDVGSGLSMKGRPGLTELCRIALDLSNGITDIIFWELDRFTRRIRDFVNLTEEIVEAGITLHLASEEEQYTQQNAQTWVLRAMGAQGESAKISKRTKAGQAAAIAEGRHIGPVPWAFKIFHEPGEEEIAGRLIPDPEVWHHCLNLWAMADRGKTPMQIANHLKQEGVPPPADEEWTAGAVLYILHNRIYTGCQVRGKEHYSLLPGPPDKTPPTIIEGAHEAAVSIETFERIQEMIAARHHGQSSPRSHTSPNSLIQIAKCGECKDRQDVEHMKNLVVRRNNGKMVLWCSRKKNSGTVTCNSRGLPFDILMERFMDRFMDRFLTEDTLRTVIETIGERGRPYLEKQDARKQNMKSRLREIKGEISNCKDVVKKFGDKHTAIESLMEDLEKLEKERRKNEKEIDEINANDTEVQQYITNPDGIIEKLLDQKTYIASQDPQLVKQLIELYVDRIEVYLNHAVIYYHLGTRKGEQPATDTIYLNKEDQAAYDSQEAQDIPDAESCLLDGHTGIFLVPGHPFLLPRRKPRRCGDLPPLRDFLQDQAVQSPPC